MYPSIGIGYWIGSYQTIHHQNVVRGLSTHVLELGIGLGHIRQYINKMLFVGGVPHIGIKYCIWSYQTTCQKNVLHGCCTHVLELGIGLGPMRWFTY